jgi:hypothetical protein
MDKEQTKMIINSIIIISIIIGICILYPIAGGYSFCLLLLTWNLQ